MRGFWKTIRLLGEAVIFRHTIFSLPITAAAILLESGGRPPPEKVVLILLAAAAGRNAANGLNRLIDSKIDGRNPRTAGRHLPRGTLSKKALALFCLAMILVLAICAALLNPLCFFLLPPAGILIGGYSFSKRFTWLCHYWLGIACAAAPMGAFLALSGHFAFRYFILAAGHALWVAGFDIIYALQDIDFDRDEELYSIPACFGKSVSRVFTLISHTGAIAAYSLIPAYWPLSDWYYAAVAITGVLLAAENIIALKDSSRHIKIASYSINEIVPLVLLAGTAAGVYLK